MNVALPVTGPSYGTQQPASAYQFAQAVLAKGHAIIGVFFYQDGVSNANVFSAPATDEPDLHALWVELANKYNIELHTCIAAAQRRGILDALTAQEAGMPGYNVEPPFLLSGLGQLAEMLLTADRVVRF
mgnify:CR=1 FL=1